MTQGMIFVNKGLRLLLNYKHPQNVIAFHQAKTSICHKYIERAVSVQTKTNNMVKASFTDAKP